MNFSRINSRISLGVVATFFLLSSCAEKPAFVKNADSKASASRDSSAPIVAKPDTEETKAGQTETGQAETGQAETGQAETGQAETDKKPAEQKQDPAEQKPQIPTEAACSRELKLMTYNLKFDNNNAEAAKDVNGWSNEKNPRRLRVKANLDKAAPDIIGTQEGKDHQIEDLKGFYNIYSFWGAGREDGKKKGEYVGIFYRKSLFKLLKGGHFWLSATPDKPGTTFPPETHSRMVSWARLNDIKSGVNYLVVNTHYALKSESRIAGSELIVKQVKSFMQNGDKVMLFGDFNSFEDKKEILFLKEQLKLEDSYRLVHKERSAKEASVNGFKGVVDGQRIDFILTPSELQVKSAEIIRDNQSGLFSSDHYPVQTKICVK